ncbi:MAG: PhzF family phenazine biosynthesis protein [Dokdonella sp.]
MYSRRFVQLDVFTDRAGYGNALAVVLDGDGLDTAAMQRFAMWTNLSETTFLLLPTTSEADYRVRIFTPRQELPFAGHPSVGSAYAALSTGLAQPRDERMVQECAAGLLPIRVAGNDDARVVHVRAPHATLRAPSTNEVTLLAAALRGVDDFDLGDCRLADNGPRFWLVKLSSGKSVRRMQPALTEITELCLATGAVGLAVYAHADRGENGDDYALAVRVYCPTDGIPEDPVTGSAQASIAAALHANGELARSGNPYRASQGREIGRDGIVEVEVDADGEVWIGGRCVIAIRGELEWN